MDEAEIVFNGRDYELTDIWYEPEDRSVGEKGTWHYSIYDVEDKKFIDDDEVFGSRYDFRDAAVSLLDHWLDDYDGDA